MRKAAGVLVILFMMIPGIVSAQGQDDCFGIQPYSHLDPSPFNPATDPDIDMFMSHWANSPARITHGTLREHDILTKNPGDQMHPKKKGAVLTYNNKVAYAFLPAGEKTSPNTLKTEQYIFYITAGAGTVTAGGTTADLHPYVGILMPPGLEYTLSNIGDKSLEMFIISESLPKGFIPNKEMIVRDEDIIPLVSIPGHWAHVPKSLFWQADDNTARFIGMNPVWIDPMTMSQPHSHQPGVEEIWLSIEGDFDVLIGKQIRKFPPGSAVRIPPSGNTPHSTINTGDSPIKTMWMMRIPAFGNMSPLNVD